ncbi:MAG: DPP IV N-terminal domain-containing protein [Acidobacteriaceae bacterium]
MRSFLVSLACLILFALPAHSQSPNHPTPNHPWTVKEIWDSGDLAGYPPSGISWSPDGQRATYLSDGNVMQIQVSDGKLKKLIDHSKIASLLDAKISEQDRDHRNRYGEPDYIWSPDSQHLLFDTNGELWLYDLRTGKGADVGNSHMQSGDDPKFSPDGDSLSYVRDHNLFVQKVQGPETPTALTNTADPALLNGEVDWVYLEELNVRSNYFWSPDSKQIAYLQMDETHVPLYPITDWLPLHPTVEEQRYPQPGDPNPAVRVGVVNAAGGPTRWLKIPLNAGNGYIPRFGWINPGVVWVETLTRDQKHLNIYFANARTGKVKLALAQTEPKYFTMTYGVKFVGDHQFFIRSWRDGYTHIYRYTFNAAHPLSSKAQLANELESGPYEVIKIGTVDQATGTVYYISNQGNPRGEQVWAVELDGSGKRQITKTPGVHEADFPKKGGSFIDTSSARLSPPTVSYCTAQGGCTPFWKSHPVQGHTLVAPELLTLKAADGKTVLYGTLQLPPNTSARASVPLIVNPYGGPAVGEAINSWGGKTFFFDQLLTQHGFAVMHVDNRGMAGRGRAFEQVAYHNFGPPQFADQMAAVDQVLAKYPQLDPHRLGWWGWSWGGTFTLYALSHSDRFLVGCSVAPVTDFRNYDSIYTERYLGLPSEEPDVYRDDAVSNSAKNLHGHIAIFHGTGDDNVHFANTIQYIQKLIEAGIPYDYNVFPRKTHSIAGPTDRTELFNRILWEFETYLKNPHPEEAR